jgi:hypothetical protein
MAGSLRSTHGENPVQLVLHSPAFFAQVTQMAIPRKYEINPVSAPDLETFPHDGKKKYKFLIAMI